MYILFISAYFWNILTSCIFHHVMISANYFLLCLCSPVEEHSYCFCKLIFWFVQVGPQAIYVVGRDDDESIAAGSEVSDDAASWETVDDEMDALENAQEVCFCLKEQYWSP